MRIPNPDKLRLVYYPDTILKKVCAPVDAFGPDLAALAFAMLALTKEAKGVGLAAPQVGIPIRLFVCNVTGEPEDAVVWVNPVFAHLDGADELEEGCLSIPGVLVTMRRSSQVVLKASDVNGKGFEKCADALLARVWQHEMDHLNGRLITDSMSPTDEIANRRALKQLDGNHAHPHSERKNRRCESPF